MTPIRKWGPLFSSTVYHVRTTGGIGVSTTTTVRRNSNLQIRNFRNFMWISMLMSLAVVFFGMQLMMVGPLKGRLDGIQTRHDLIDQSLRQLVTTHDGVKAHNSLVDTLLRNEGQMDKLRQRLNEFTALRHRIDTEANAAQEAMKSLEAIAGVQNQVIDASDSTKQAVAELAQLEKLRTRVINSGEQTEVADNSFNGMVALQNRVIAASNGYEEASTSVENMADLTQRLIESEKDLKVASERFDQFMGLNNRMIASAENQEKADESLRTLIAMKETLTGDNMKLDLAQKNLDQIAALQTKIDQQSTRVADAIDSLELMDDFHTEVDTHIHSLRNLRRTLVELAMMESTVSRVASVISPLAELGNLRRLSEREVRDAARVIMSERSSRNTRKVAMDDSADTAIPVPVDETEETGGVPLPKEPGTEE
ncbi:MAG TPA: hypothetical protein DCG12_05215 [Planctomycetaceae bacterium]|nr:hypothetical protein [Planctomycetaceae bacterium]